MDVREDQRFDDLALDYSLGEVLQALSIRDAREELPSWAVPYLSLLTTALSFPPDLPSYVVDAAAAACQMHGYPLPAIVGGLRYVGSGGTAVPDCGMRTLRGFLEEWRKQLRKLRPAPQFSLRPR